MNNINTHRSSLNILAVAAVLCFVGGHVLAANLLKHGQFEKADGWKLQLHKGARGGVSISTAHVKSGQHSLKLSKTNGMGYMVFKTVKPIKVKAGVKYRFRGYFHSEDATLGTALLFRITSSSHKALSYDSIDRSAGWSSQSLLFNSPPGRWEPRVIGYKSSKNTEIYLNIILYGNPATVWIDDLQLTSTPYKPKKNGGSDFKLWYTKAQVLDALSKRKNTTAKIAVKNGRSKLMVNGKVTAPVLYKTSAHHIITGAQYHGMYKAGVNIETVRIQMGGVRNRLGVWRGENQYNFDRADKRIMTALRKNPNAILILELTMYPYIGWGKKHLDEIWRNAKGEYGYGLWGNLEGFTSDPTLKKLNTSKRTYWLYPSYESNAFRRDGGKAITALIKHLQTTAMWKAVGGFFISGGQDEQFVAQTFEYDYSAATVHKFHHWLKNKYKTIANANKIWNSHYSRFSAVAIPVPASHTGGIESGSPYLSPSVEIDYRKFLMQQAWSIKDYFAGVAKTSAKKPIVTMSYYGSEPRLYNFLHTKHIDITGGMAYYPYRLPGYATGYGTENGLSLHHKMFFQEVDLRSWVGSIYGNEVYQLWVGAGDTPKRWKEINQKLVGMSIANNYGYWYYDMNHYFDDPKIVKRIARSLNVVKKYWDNPSTNWNPDVTVVITPYSQMYYRPEYSSVALARAFQRMALETSGVAYQVQYLDDILENPKLQNSKVYIFLSDNYINSHDRRRINKVLKNSGRTLVWMYDTGYLSENGSNIQAMSKLIGMKIKTKQKYARQKLLTTHNSSPLTRKLKPTLGMSELLLALMHIRGSNSFYARYQPFWIDNSSVTPLAKYKGTGRIAMAVKDKGDWRSIYLAAPNSLGNQLLHNIAVTAGAYVYGPAGQSVFMNNNFVSLSALHSGKYTLRLPEKRSKVIDPFTGKVLASGVRSYTFPVTAQKTYWFFLK